MADKWMERKFAELPTEPLFDAPARTGRREGRPRRSRNVNRRDCPKCGRLTGIYVKSIRAHRPVLAWRRHWRMTGSGASLLCAASDTEATP